MTPRRNPWLARLVNVDLKEMIKLALLIGGILGGCEINQRDIRSVASSSDSTTIRLEKKIARLERRLDRMEPRKHRTRVAENPNLVTRFWQALPFTGGNS